MRHEVSTLPAATAAPGRACTTVPSRVRIEIGRRAPAEAGASGAVTTRTAYRHALTATARGQLTLPACCGPHSPRSISSSSPRTVTRA